VLAVLVVISGTTTWIRDGLGWPLIVNESPVKSDVIIVLGSGTRKTGDHLGPQAKQRVLEGLILERQGWVPRIIMSGGRDNNTHLVEAEQMTNFARAQGFSGEIVQENESTDTWQNAKFSTTIMQDHQWPTALVVTSPYHTWRACRVFHKQQATAHCVPAPFSLYPSQGFVEYLRDTRAVVREYGAIVYNWAKGQL